MCKPPIFIVVIAVELARKTPFVSNLGGLGDFPTLGGRVGLVVRALAFHQCGPGSLPALGVICGLSLLVLYSAMRGFSPATPVFPSHQKPIFDLISLVK